MADLQGLLANLLTPVDKQAQLHSQGMDMVSLLKAGPGATAAYYAPTRVDSIKGSLGRMLGMDMRDPTQKMQEQLAAKTPQTAADFNALADQLTQMGDPQKAAMVRAMGAQAATEAKATEATSAQVANMQSAIGALAKRAGIPELAAAATGTTDPAQLTTLLKQAQEALKDTGGLTRNQQAQLYSKFTPESIAAYTANPATPLVPIKTPEETKISTHGQMLIDSGIPLGTPAFQDRMLAYTDSLTMRNVQGDAPTAVEVVDSLNGDLQRNPLYENTEQSLAELRKLNNTLPLLDSNNPQAYTVISSSLPMLYQTNSRAQSEIDNFRSRKGIAESLGDWVTKIGGGTATKETIGNMKELIGILDASLQQEKVTAVTKTGEGWRGLYPDDVINRWMTNQLSGPEPIDALVERYGKGR